MPFNCFKVSKRSPVALDVDARDIDRELDEAEKDPQIRRSQTEARSCISEKVLGCIISQDELRDRDAHTGACRAHSVRLNLHFG